MRPVPVLADQLLDGDRVDVARPSSRLVGRKTNVDLGRLALGTRGNNGLPVVIVEPVAGGVARDGVTRRVVVELDKELVKGGLSDHLVHVRDGRERDALGSSSNQQRGIKRAERVDHLDVRTVG